MDPNAAYIAFRAALRAGQTEAAKVLHSDPKAMAGRWRLRAWLDASPESPI